MNKYSNYKIAWFPEKLQSFKAGRITAPIFVRIKPTNRCNHDCPTCIYEPSFIGMHSSMSRNDELSEEKLFEVIRDLHEMEVKAVLWSGGGEPLMHPYILNAFKKTREYGMQQALVTNGHKLKDKIIEEVANFDWIRVSFDYYNKESFIKVRKASESGFDKILKNSKEFAKQKNPNCDFGSNFIVSKENYMYMFEMASMLKDIGFENIRFCPLWITNLVEYHSRIKSDVLTQINKCRERLEDDNFKVYDSYNTDPSFQYSSYKKCYVMQTVPVIAADYNVYACHNKAYDHRGLIGSIKDQSFKELWFSEDAKERFETLNPLTACNGHQCSSNKRNILITDIMDAGGINFI
jgi:MoaA/NifB/PqqE/SkfB family radical SAM enzyme